MNVTNFSHGDIALMLRITPKSNPWEVKKMEIIINGEKVKGDIREIMMTNASGDVTIIKSLGDNQCLRKEKGDYFYFIRY